MRWTVHGERSLYESEWVSLRLVDVELPDGERFEHHVVRLPVAAASCVIEDPERGFLLLWRHRFITDTWGWEVPAVLLSGDHGAIAQWRRRQRVDRTQARRPDLLSGGEGDLA